MAAPADLTGFTIGITADRRGEDQALMFRRLGAEVVHGPTMQTISVPDPDLLLERTRLLIGRPPDYLIANTGMGIRMWMSQVEQWGLTEEVHAALRHARIAARGPKAYGALSIAGFDVWWRSPSEQLSDVVQHLIAEGIEGRLVVFQLQGDDREDITERLRGAGAEVLELPVYRWETPSRAERAMELIEMCCERKMDAVTFTAGPQVRSMFELAEASGRSPDLLAALNGGMVVGCIGPVCAESASAEGIVDCVVPEHWRLGSLVKAVSDALINRK